MQELGLAATELGSDGYLPTDPGELREVCARYDLKMIGGLFPSCSTTPLSATPALPLPNGPQR